MRDQHQWIYDAAAEMCDILGIKTPKVLLFADAKAEMRRYEKLMIAETEALGLPPIGNKGEHIRLMGLAIPSENKIIIKQVNSPFAAVRKANLLKVISHELIHLKYLDDLEHGTEFDKQVDDLVRAYKEREKKEKEK